MRILGIDPGTATTGFGAVESSSKGVKFIGAGIISTPKTDAMPSRLVTIHEGLEELIKEYEPDAVAVELLYFAQNVTTAMTVSQARGVILMTAAKMGLPVFEYTPLQVKQALTGYGRAQKPQIQQMVKTLLRLDSIPKPDDAADGLAIALTHAQSYKFTKTTKDS